MTTFDELIGAEPTGAERARLRNVHELLLDAGPPPEIAPELASGPTLEMTLSRARRVGRSRRTIYVVLAAAFLTLIVALATTGHEKAIVAIPLHGTAAAPGAIGAINVLPADGRTQPMRIETEGLAPGSYAVYLLPRTGNQWDKCGQFTVTAQAGTQAATINSPYLARKNDKWVVTTVTPKGRGVTVLRPAKT
jgi:hypothetical protein